VHVLKCVNCAYRAPVLKHFGFDEAIHGTGVPWAAARHQSAQCLRVGRAA
jgi:hypothetical protein